MAEFRRISVVDIGDLTTVRINARKLVAAAEIEEMLVELRSLVERPKMKHLLLDFDGVEFLSSAALNALILVNKQVRQAGGSMRLRNVRSEIREVFRITRLDRTFDFGQPGEDDDDLEAWGAWVPRPTPPDNLDGQIGRSIE